MKSLSLGIVRASASSALAYSRLCSGKPDLFCGGTQRVLSRMSHAAAKKGTP
ncbi:MAG: hypothetical protein LBQ31_07160 [Bacteroidales bacterium]|nr:hypothetical protein [Bacteroidales bacterium]